MDEQKAQPTSVPKLGFDKAVFDNALYEFVEKKQELVRQAMKRSITPVVWSVRDSGDQQIRVFGSFTADELEAMAWCMRNDKWPVK